MTIVGALALGVAYAPELKFVGGPNADSAFVKPWL
jgi:hypothetical protein